MDKNPTGICQTFQKFPFPFGVLQFYSISRLVYASLDQSQIWTRCNQRNTDEGISIFCTLIHFLFSCPLSKHSSDLCCCRAFILIVAYLCLLHFSHINLRILGIFGVCFYTEYWVVYDGMCIYSSTAIFRSILHFLVVDLKFRTTYNNDSSFNFTFIYQKHCVFPKNATLKAEASIALTTPSLTFSC